MPYVCLSVSDLWLSLSGCVCMRKHLETGFDVFLNHLFILIFEIVSVTEPASHCLS